MPTREEIVLTMERMYPGHWDKAVEIVKTIAPQASIEDKRGSGAVAHDGMQLEMVVGSVSDSEARRILNATSHLAPWIDFKEVVPRGRRRS